VSVPIEVYKAFASDPDAVKTVQFPVPSGIQPLSLFLYANNLSYQNKAAVQINGGDPILLGNANSAVHLLEPYDQYGGIGSAVQTIKLTVDLPAGSIKPGQINSLTFIMNRDDPDSVSMGYRIISFNLQDSSGRDLLPAETFSVDDPAKWTTPLNAVADIQNGQLLWSGALLHKSSSDSSPIIAHCNDCHTPSGIDLKYFNFSNYSIQKRAQFHGLSVQQGQQIASFIRSIQFTAPGSPWDPPYQPGPSVLSNPRNAWAAGGGGDAVVPDALTANYLPGGGTRLSELKDASGSSMKPFPMHAIPTAIQFAVWNQWLPRVHPYDVLGVANYQASGAYQKLTSIRQSLAGSAESVLRYIQSFQLMSDSETLDDGMYDVFKRISLQNTGISNPTYCGASGLSSTMPDQIQLSGFQAYQAAKLTAVNVWELNHLFDLNRTSPNMPHLNLEQISQSLMGQLSSNRNWLFPNIMNHISPRIIAQFYCDHRFDAINGPITVGQVTHFEGDTDASVTNHYLSNMWYELDILLSPGNRESPFDSFQNNDWLYFQASLVDFAIRSNKKIQPMNNVIYSLRSFEEHMNGIGPAGKAAGWNYRDNNTHFLQLSGAAPGDNPIQGLKNGWLSQPGMIPVLQSVYQFWMESNALFSSADWFSLQQNLPSYDGENIPPQSYVLRDGTADPNTSWADQLAGDLFYLKNTYNVKSALLSGMTNFTKMLWPASNWSIYRNPASALTAAPGGLSAVSGVEQILLSWSAVAGASSYNVKRATGSDPNFLTVAYFVGPPNYLDRNLVPGQTYRYVISANDTNDQNEGADSIAASAVPGTGLVAEWQIQNSSRIDGALVPDQTSTHADAINYQALDGQYFSGTLVNLAKWLGGSATLSVWIKWNPALAAANEDLSSTNPTLLSGIAGSAPFTGANNGYATTSSLYWGVTRASDSTHLQFGGMMGCTSAGPAIWSNPTAAWNDGLYHLLVMTRDQQSGLVSFYIDGQPAGSGTSGTGICQGKSFSLGRIERQMVNMNHSVYPGNMCDIRVYDKVVDSSSVAQIYQSGAGLCK